MPITKSAKKELRKNIKRRAINDKYRKDAKVAMKIFLKKVAKKENLTEKDLAYVYSKIDKLAKKHIVHKKNAARKKSRIAKAFNLMRSLQSS